MNQRWIDFRALRRQLDFEQVLKSYGVELKRKKDLQLVGFCPLPGHNGQRKSPSFSVNVERNCFNCFGCQRGGNCLDFAILMEGKDPDNRQHVREVALLLCERFRITEADEPTSARSSHPPSRPNDGSNRGSPAAQPGRREPSATPITLDKPANLNGPPAIVNAPLDFTLKGIDPTHPYLRKRGFSDKTIRHFGLGFCIKKGLMQGRVAIPLHDPAGKLIGYAGRFTRDDQISEENPKYRFPGDRQRNGARLEFRKSLFLYNGHAIKAPVDDLVVVEGFTSVWWLHQCGFENVVALMGNSCSPEQAVLIRDYVPPSGRVWLMPDAGEGGERCAENVLPQIAQYRFVHWVKLDEGQPTDLSPEDLMQLLTWEAA